MEEEGFYKLEVGQKRSVLLFATHLENASFILDKDLKDTYTYPIDGWRYFDTLSEACIHHNVSEEDWREILFPLDDIISEEIV